MVDVSTQQPLDTRQRLTVTIAPSPATAAGAASGRSPPPPPPPQHQQQQPLTTAASAAAAVFNRSPPPPPPPLLPIGIMPYSSSVPNTPATSPTTAAMPTPAAATTTPSTTTTPHALFATRSAPSMSPVTLPGAKVAGRGLRQKMIDELKSVRRKSDRTDKHNSSSSSTTTTPALSPLLETAAVSAAGSLPPPLMLNASSPPTSSGGMNYDPTTELRLSHGDEGAFPNGWLATGNGQLSPSDATAMNSDPNAKTKGCALCERSFTVFRAKHTCKVCGCRICDDCSKNRVKLHRRLERKRGSRLCDPCARKFVTQTQTAIGCATSPTPAGVLQRRHSVPNASFIAAAAATAAGASPSAAATTPTATEAYEPSDVVAADAATGTAAAKTNALLPAPRRKFYKSHLRLRHFVALLLIATLASIRLVLGARFASSIIVQTLDCVLSLQLVLCYVCGLVLYDEVSRARRVRPAAVNQRRRRRRRTHSKATPALSTNTQQQQQPLPHSSINSSHHLTPLPPANDDDVLTVDTGDAVDPTAAGGFSLETLVAALDAAAASKRTPDTNELQLDAFLTSCEAICAFVLVFGRATSFAGSTVGGYITSIDANLAQWPSTGSNPWRMESVRAVVEREVALEIASVGGKKKPSCARCILRLLWFVEFVAACLKYTLIENVDESCSSGASRAYEETIGSRHPWIVRKGVNSALGSIPTRSAILADLHLANVAPDVVVKRLEVAQLHLRTIISELHAVLKKHDLLDIK